MYINKRMAPRIANAVQAEIKTKMLVKISAIAS